MDLTGRYNLVDCDEHRNLCPLKKSQYLQMSGNCFLSEI